MWRRAPADNEQGFLQSRDGPVAGPPSTHRLPPPAPRANQALHGTYSNTIPTSPRRSGLLVRNRYALKHAVGPTGPATTVLDSSTRGVICRYHATRLGPALACLGASSYALLLYYHSWLLRMVVSSWTQLEASPSSAAKWQRYGWNYRVGNCAHTKNYVVVFAKFIHPPKRPPLNPGCYLLPVVHQTLSRPSLTLCPGPLECLRLASRLHVGNWTVHHAAE